MNKMIITMTAKSGKAREALAAVKAAGEYIAGKYDMKSEAYMQVLGGTAGTIYIIGDYKDIAAAQAMQGRLMADEAYWNIVQKMAEVLISPPTITLLQPV